MSRSFFLCSPFRFRDLLCVCFVYIDLCMVVFHILVSSLMFFFLLLSLSSSSYEFRYFIAPYKTIYISLILPFSRLLVVFCTYAPVAYLCQSTNEEKQIFAVETSKYSAKQPIHTALSTHLPSEMNERKIERHRKQQQQ